MTGALLVQRHMLGQQRTAVGALADHGARVSVLTHAFAMDGFEPAVFGDVTVCNLNSTEQIERIADWLVSTRRLSHVIALHEKMIGFAAGVRRRWNMPGMWPETAARFRDKILMKAIVSAAGLAVPRYLQLTDRSDIAAADWSGGPMVLKPRNGLGSERTAVVHSADEAVAQWIELDDGTDGFELEEFVPGRMFHVDSVVIDRAVVFNSVSEYLSRPLDFVPGGSLCSVTLEPGALFDRLVEFSVRAVESLGLVAGVTHLEAFLRPDGEIVFCEVAARPGGGGLDRVVQRAYAVDLMRAAALAECGLPNDELQAQAPRDAGVWALVGMYPLPGREQTPARERLRELGAVEYKHNPIAGFRAGVPVHAAEFADVLIVHAPDRAGLVDRYHDIQREYGVGPDAFVEGDRHG